MKKYTKYKVTEIEWLGEIPYHWDIKPLKYLLQEIISGGTPATSSEEYWDNENGKNWVSIADITKSDNVLFETEKKISEEGANSKNLKIIKKGTLLISIFASLGKIIILGNDSYVNQAILALIPNSNLEQSYLKYYFYFIQQYLDYYSSSNTQDNLNAFKIKNLTIPQPDLSEQLAISNFLNKKTSIIDKLISNKEKLIELLQEERTELINNAVTKGINSKAKMKSSGIEWLGEIPEHWKMKKLKYLLNQNFYEQDKIDTDFKITLENIESGTGNLLPNNETSFEGIGNLFNEGDILFNKLRPYLEKVLLADRSGICVTDLLVLSPNTEISSKFLFYRTLSKNFMNEVNSSTYGVKMPRASWDFISQMIIPYPTIAEQNGIVEFIEKRKNIINTMITKIEKEIELIQEYRTALISEAVTGRIDLRNE